MLKIISGIKKNTNIEQPSSVTRPTMQRVRKTIFDMIFKEVKGKNVLDCFAGSGAMGFEALSIAARKAYFIENDKSAFHIIKSNASKLSFNDKSVIINADFFKPQTFKHLIKDKIDIVFIDPPYGKFRHEDILSVLNELGIKGLCIFETNEMLENLEYQILNLKKISDKYITFFKNFTS